MQLSFFSPVFHQFQPILHPSSLSKSRHITIPWADGHGRGSWRKWRSSAPTWTPSGTSARRPARRRRRRSPRCGRKLGMELMELMEWPKVVEGWTSVTSFCFAMVCRWWNLMCQSGRIVKHWDDIFLTLWPWWVFQVVTGFLPFSIQSFIIKKSMLDSYLRKHHTTPVKEEFAPNLMVQNGSDTPKYILCCLEISHIF